MAAKKKSAASKPAKKSKATPATATTRRTQAKSEPIGDPYEEKLPCPIPLEQVHAAGEALAGCIEARAAWLEKRKAENAKARDERAYYDNRIEELGKQITLKSETRRIKCQDFLVVKDGRKVIECVRLDTKAVIHTREANADELQTDLFGDDDKPGKGKKKPKAEDLAPRPGELRGPPAGVVAPYVDEPGDPPEGGAEDPDLE